MNPPRSTPPPLRSPGRAALRRDIDRIVHRLVPRSADFCLLHLVSRGSIRAIAWAHATPGGERLLRLLTRRYRISPQDRSSGVASVLRSGRPLLRTAIQIDEAVAGRGDASVVELHRELGPRSALVVPIVTPTAVLGALTLGFSHSPRTYAARDVPGAVRVAARIARILAPPADLARLRASEANPAARTATTLRRRPDPRH